uniref:Putative secreted protein n=1 Tax=Anopheles darlingi TaxID=43151 RepID=A0A2M4D5G3_ANODA
MVHLSLPLSIRFSSGTLISICVLVCVRCECVIEGGHLLLCYGERGDVSSPDPMIILWSLFQKENYKLCVLEKKASNAPAVII